VLTLVVPVLLPYLGRLLGRRQEVAGEGG